MQTATSETEIKYRYLSICVHHYTLRAPCPKGQGKHPGLELCGDRRQSIRVNSGALFRLEACRVALYLARGYIFHALHWFYFYVIAGVHGQARAPEPSAPERAAPPPRRRRSCDSPKPRTDRRQPHPPQPTGLTPTSASAAATAQSTRPLGQTPRHSRPLVHDG